MFNKNVLWLGLVLGLTVPIVSAATMMLVDDFAREHVQIGRFAYNGLDKGFFFLMGIMGNLIPFHYFLRRKYDDSMRGVVLPTVLYCVLWLLKWGIHIVD